jgi:hypothetical protein
MPKIEYTAAKGLFQSSGSGVTGLLRRNIIEVGANASTTLTTAQSGALVLLNGTVADAVVQLPYITSNDVGVYYDFHQLTEGNSTAAGSHLIKTGGHATDTSGDSNTAAYDDFIGMVLVVDPVAVIASDKTNAVPGADEGVFDLALDTANGAAGIGTRFRCTAVAASTTVAGANVWLIEGIVMGEATGWVTTALFTA